VAPRNPFAGITNGWGAFLGLALTLGAIWAYSRHETDQRQHKAAVAADVREHFADYEAKAATLTGDEKQAFKVERMRRERSAKEAQHESELRATIAKCASVIPPDQCESAFRCDDDPVECVFDRDLADDVLDAMPPDDPPERDYD
jgi:hypothetical protein